MIVRRLLRGIIFTLLALFALIVLRVHIGFWLNKGHYDDVAHLALELNLPAGQRGTFDYSNDQLKPEPQGRIRVASTIDRGVVIKMDKGGGHLGVQGMVYTSDGALKTIVDSGIVHTEVMAFTRMSRKWWFYDSAED